MFFHFELVTRHEIFFLYFFNHFFNLSTSKHFAQKREQLYEEEFNVRSFLKHKGHLLSFENVFLTKTNETNIGCFFFLFFVFPVDEAFLVKFFFLRDGTRDVSSSFCCILARYWPGISRFKSVKWLKINLNYFCFWKLESIFQYVHRKKTV